MSPEQEWECEEKLDNLSYHLEQLVLDVFINVVRNLKLRYVPLTDPTLKSEQEEIPF